MYVGIIINFIFCFSDLPILGVLYFVRDQASLSPSNVYCWNKLLTKSKRLYNNEAIHKVIRYIDFFGYVIVYFYLVPYWYHILVVNSKQGLWFRFTGSANLNPDTKRLVGRDKSNDCQWIAACF